ncbi:hypothetical protein Tco_0465238, partial [Tanacetum coccineum]
SFDEQEAIRLQAEFDEEVRLAREKDEANVALIKEWNDIQANIDADYQMAKQIQVEEQEELSIEEKSKLFNMAGWKPKYLKNKSFANIQELFDKAMKRVNTFVDIDTKLVEGSEVRAEANGSSKRYSAFIQLLRSFDKEDLETLWKLVKAKHGYTRPEEGYERVLWGDLKIMVEHHVEDTGRIVGIKRLLDDLRVTAAKLMLLVKKLLLLVLKVNAAGMKVTIAERLKLLEEFMLTEKRSKTYQRKYKDFLKIKIT